MRPGAISRRQFVLGAGASSAALLVGCGRLPGQAQPTAKVYRVGFIQTGVPDVGSPLALLREGMAEHGYMEGQNLVIEYRWAEGALDRLPELANELIDLPVDVIIVAGGPAVRAAQAATSTIPVVVAIGGDLVVQGNIASLARPGANVTGLSIPLASLSGKRLQLLKQAAPEASRVIVPRNATSPALAVAFADTQDAAGMLGVQLISVDISGPIPEWESAVETAAAERANALLTLQDSLVFAHRDRIVGLATKHRLPSMFSTRQHTAVGALMSYGANPDSMYRRAAYYVDRILKGTKPADLPVEQPMTFDFVVNMKTARELGITFPNEILLQVTEMIE